MRLVRKLYDWVLHWAETPYGGPALFLLALVESSVFPVPPDVLLIALCIALPSRAWRFALLASAGSVLGGLIGYGVGWGAWPLVNHFFFNYIPGFTPDVFERVQDLFARYDVVSVVDPWETESGRDRVRRGGSWFGPGYSCRSANRAFGHPMSRLQNTGFRLVMVLPDRQDDTSQPR
jgi:membrane protein YqaA with SNARE-associated domain